MSGSLLLISGLLLALFCLLGWVLQWATRNGGYADLIWITGLTATALFYLLLADGHWVARLGSGALILVWGVRLGVHVLQRVVCDGQEDARYAAMRERLGSWINIFHLFFFLAQGLLAWVFALVFAVIAHQQQLMPIAVAVGLALGASALAGEAVADRQLARWRENPANRGYTCRQGLWRYSRHPNYFFEWLHWFSYPLIGLGAAYGFWLWLAPVVMFLFLWFVTGIPYTERQAIKSRGDDYRQYQRTTSAFIPWQPRPSERSDDA